MEEEPTIRLGWVKELMPLAMLVISGLVWGMKLEARNDKLELMIQSDQKQMAQIMALLERGMLPVTAERLGALQERMRKLESDCLDRDKVNAN